MVPRTPKPPLLNLLNDLLLDRSRGSREPSWSCCNGGRAQRRWGRWGRWQEAVFVGAPRLERDSRRRTGVGSKRSELNPPPKCRVTSRIIQVETSQIRRFLLPLRRRSRFPSRQRLARPIARGRASKRRSGPGCCWKGSVPCGCCWYYPYRPRANIVRGRGIRYGGPECLECLEGELGEN